MYQYLTLEYLDNGVGLLTINRPQALNALNRELLEELACVLEQVAGSVLKALVVTGAGRAFVAGADIAEMKEMGAEQAEAFSRRGQEVFARLAALPQVTVAAVNGYALGGGMELALACDLRLAADKAKLGQPEITLGIIPGFGGTVRLPRLVGTAKAMELLATGRMVDAHEAERIGLVNRVLPFDELRLQAQQLAEQIGRMSKVTLQLLKQAVVEGKELSHSQAEENEAMLFGRCFNSQDQKEGMTAFLEKRPARFTDK